MLPVIYLCLIITSQLLPDPDVGEVEPLVENVRDNHFAFHKLVLAGFYLSKFMGFFQNFLDVGINVFPLRSGVLDYEISDVLKDGVFGLWFNATLAADLDVYALMKITEVCPDEFGPVLWR